jgi:glycosyltransferase involved in cell wall biosynthesis
LFVGRLVEKKGCRYLIEAMAQIQKSDPQIGLVVIGDGPLRTSLERQARRLLRSVRFLGWQPQEAVQSWMNRATVFCAPSITSSKGETEGLPLTILEAQAMGLLVISTSHAGIPEAIKDRGTGLLVSEKDPQGLAVSIQELFNDSTLREELATAARKQIEQKFSIETNVALLEDVYHSVLINFGH